MLTMIAELPGKAIQAAETTPHARTTKMEYLCDCEDKLPFAVLTVWDCQHCGDLHERVTNCACGKCIELYETEREVETT
jgi:hypothetical protein